VHRCRRQTDHQGHQPTRWRHSESWQSMKKKVDDFH
jgi:hypothetical protein